MRVPFTDKTLYKTPRRKVKRELVSSGSQVEYKGGDKKQKGGHPRKGRESIAPLRLDDSYDYTERNAERG